ncbi:DsbA family protein [Nocardia australiensis]|uniref:DsbA family protein n=1 Tax=Nocardia australiensis TaxID=2887191 RepID=UPI001D14418F|nr:thioredoxin domain-containing protein [Nocardia australiensis]
MSNKTTYALGAVAVVLIAVIVILAMRWGRGEPAPRNDGYGPVRNPSVVAVLAPDGAILVGRPDAAKTVDVYEDPLCPGCGSMERIHGQEIAQLQDEGKLAVRYHLVNFLESKSPSKDYSTRAIAANECVAEAGSGPVYSKFHELVFATKQPTEGGADLSNAELADVAREAGASEQVQQCISGGAKVDAARANAQVALGRLNELLNGRASTPSAFDGQSKLDVNNEEWVADLTR